MAHRCGDDLESLQRFVDAQRMAFHKILKKYKVLEDLPKSQSILAYNIRNGPVPGLSVDGSMTKYWAIPKASQN